jgi:galactokinase
MGVANAKLKARPVPPPAAIAGRPALQMRFGAEFKLEPGLYRAPGRVNLIGEHTDDNDGFMLPEALDLSTWVAAALGKNRTLRFKSLLGGEALEFTLDDPAPVPRHDWSDYARRVAVTLQAAGFALKGADMMIDSDAPIGSGLRSSAALDVSVGFALLDVAVDRVKLAQACQRAESEFVGMHCGVMDPFISCLGVAGQALPPDCGSLDYRPAPIAPSVRLVVCNSTAHHKLASGEYNLRRAERGRGVALLTPLLPGVRTLRDVTLAQLVAHEAASPEVAFRRRRHVVTEDERVLKGVAALEAENVVEFGRLANASHRSLRDAYQVSCRELDILAELAWGIEGALGSRMMEGGFGGWTLSIVRVEAVERFTADLAKGYAAATKLTPEIFLCLTGDGVSVVTPLEIAA